MIKRGYTEPFKLVESRGKRSRLKYTVLVLTMFVFLLVGVITSSRLNKLPPTFNGQVDVAELQKNPESYSLDQADGAASVIVSENLAKTNAQNVCFSVVFNFRGYDTMGESFILIAALAGSLCILRTPKTAKKKHEEGGTEA